MAETKTQPTDASVDAYLASRASPEQLGRHTMGKSCLYFKRLADLMPRFFRHSLPLPSPTQRRYPPERGARCPMEIRAIRSDEIEEARAL
jgi:hypothetical protein